MSFTEALEKGFIDSRMTSVVTDEGETINLKEAIDRGIIDVDTGCMIGK